MKLNQKKKLFKGESEFDLNAVKIVKGKDLNYLIQKAQKTKRKRYRFCLHENTNHLTQEMIICLNGFTYIRPHRHLEKRSESYHMIKGSMDVYLFKNNIKLSSQKREGFCNLGSRLVYEDYNDQFSNIKLDLMKKNKDPDYGKGYIIMSKILKQNGWHNLLINLEKW